MDELKNIKFPFTLYDIFGYLIPGLTFCVLLLLSEDLLKSIDFIISTIYLNKEIEVPNFVFNQILILFERSPFFIFPFILLVSYIVGHLIAAISSLVVERFIVEKILNYPTQNLFFSKTDNPKFLFPKYRKPYSKDFVKNFKTEFSKKMGLPVSNANDVFWISFEYVSYNCPNTFARAMHFLNLYGYCRNLAMTFILSALSLIIIDCIYDLSFNFVLIISYLFIAGTLFWNYLKFLRRLNDEIFRGFYTHIKMWPNNLLNRKPPRVA